MKLQEKLELLGISAEHQTVDYFDQLLLEVITLKGISHKHLVYGYEKVLPVKRRSPLLVHYREVGETMVRFC